MPADYLIKRLKHYNNQARDESKVGGSLALTVFQTVFAALYDDRLTVEFEDNDEGDKAPGICYETSLWPDLRYIGAA